MSLSMRIFLVLLAALFFVLPSSIYAFDELNQNTIKEMLREPGVKLIAVDFYATWCEPCNKAIPKWKKLQEKYGSKGLKIVVISVQSGGSCAQPPNWTPDKIICDYEGEISNRWNAQSLPQAFLWSWQGNLLVANGQAEDVGKAIEQYFMKIPRVLVEEPADKTIYKLVRSELIKNSKMEILASEKEMDALRELSKKSRELNYDEKLECVLGQEVSANSRLTISRQKRGSKEFLILELFSVEKGCLVASGISLVQGDIETVVARASYDLLKNLFGDVAMPGKKEEKASPKPDEKACEYAKEKDDRKVWSEYLKEYPQGNCAFEAKMKIKENSDNEEKTETKEDVEKAGKKPSYYDIYEEMRQKHLNKQEEEKNKKSLTWSKIAPKTMNWNDAKKYCANLNKDGHSDWRLPTISELRTLIKNCPATETGGACKVTNECLSWKECRNDACGGCSDASDGRYSKLGDTEWFWSSSEQSDNASSAWYVDFSSGLVSNYDKGYSNGDVRCVR